MNNIAFLKMSTYSVRISKIKISNFKNTLNGEISLTNTRKNFKASVLGIYGQNGSGKTSLIEAINLLKYALTGQQIPVVYSNYISVNSEQTDRKASFVFDFELKNNTEVIPVSYSFSIKAEKVNNDNLPLQNTNSSTLKVFVVDESLECPIYSDKTDSKRKMGKALAVDPDEVLIPKCKKHLFAGNSTQAETDLKVAKQLAYERSVSFLFSYGLIKIIRDRYNSNSLSVKDKSEFEYYYNLIESLISYGHTGLFVIRTASSGLLSLNIQTLNFKYNDGNTGALGSISIPLNDSGLIPAEAFSVVTKVFSNLNIVLSKIIPGLTIDIRNLGEQILSDGNKGYRVQLMSQKNRQQIPLEYESEGIKKIISILQLLIVVYNDPSTTVAIDELDSGIFEYLLGEILSIVSENGKGQLIFTSHNLRPLETIDKSFIAFTTVNSNDRYVRATNVKSTNNLRDIYFRNLMLDEYRDDLYEKTNNSEIAFAFREAGVNSGS